MHIPKVSIGLPVYNGERYIRCAINSILKQTFDDFELIISDNASEDRTAAICKGYEERDKRIHYHRFETNQGAARNFTAVFEMARGEYFKWAAYDDICLPRFLERCVDAMDSASQSVVVVVPRIEIVDESGKPRTIPVPPESSDLAQARAHERLAKLFRTVHWAPAQYGLVRRDVLKKTRLLEPFVESDYVLLAELALLGEIVEVPEILLQLRSHPQTAVKPYIKGEDAVLSWFDPTKNGRKSPLQPHTRIGLEYLRSIKRMPLPLGERTRCYWTMVTVWCPIEIRRSMQDLRAKVAIRSRIDKILRRTTKADK